MILGIIPARGGSVRIPRKNVKDLAGKPMMAWTIEAAKASKIDRFVVTTEDAEIANVAEAWGAEVFDRDPKYADSSIYDAIFEVMDAIPSTWVVLLHPTSPLRTAEDIDACIDLCMTHAAPSCVSCEFTVPVPNGAVYVAYSSWLREHRNFDGPRTVVYQMPTYRSVDVNVQADLERAEVLLKNPPKSLQEELDAPYTARSFDPDGPSWGPA